MRLSPIIVQTLIDVMGHFLQNHAAHLFLYGSRTKDELKGGDIDLLLLIEDPQVCAEQNAKKHLILNEIKKSLGDRRIDLTIADRQSADTASFIQMALQNSVSLGTFPHGGKKPAPLGKIAKGK